MDENFKEFIEIWSRARQGAPIPRRANLNLLKLQTLEGRLGTIDLSGKEAQFNWLSDESMSSFMGNPTGQPLHEAFDMSIREKVRKDIAKLRKPGLGLLGTIGAEHEGDILESIFVVLPVTDYSGKICLALLYAIPGEKRKQNAHFPLAARARRWETEVFKLSELGNI